MNQRKEILNVLEKVQYVDMHIHMEDLSENELDKSDSILYFANAVDLESYEKTLKLSENSELIIPSFGIHPMKAAEVLMNDKELTSIISQNDFVGEIGIDFFWEEDEKTYPWQIDIFEQQLRLVKDNNCIPSIHTKGAEYEILKLLKQYSIKKAIIHWYSGPVELIEDFLDIGCYFTIGPDIFSYSKVYKMIPLDRMFAETDNPTGMPWIQGGEAQIDDIKKVYKQLSLKLGIDEEQLITIVKQNLRDIIARG